MGGEESTVGCRLLHLPGGVPFGDRGLLPRFPAAVGQGWTGASHIFQPDPKGG